MTFELQCSLYLLGSLCFHFIYNTYESLQLWWCPSPFTDRFPILCLKMAVFVLHDVRQHLRLITYSPERPAIILTGLSSIKTSCRKAFKICLRPIWQLVVLKCNVLHHITESSYQFYITREARFKWKGKFILKRPSHFCNSHINIHISACWNLYIDSDAFKLSLSDILCIFYLMCVT